MDSMALCLTCSAPDVDAPLEDVKKWHLQRALVRHRGNHREVAHRLGMSRSTLRNMLVRMAVDVGYGRPGRAPAA